jgi:hypothetical protein
VGVTTADVSSVVSELTRTIRETNDFISRVNPAHLTAADRAALGALLDDLAELMSTANQLE